ncbi:MAG: hypothetical protein ACNA8N_06885 [Trueperaceae bacterium]
MSFRFDLSGIDRRRLVPGLILIGIGVLGLFGTLGWLGGLGGLPGLVLFGAAAYFAHLQARQTGSRFWRLAVYPLAGLAIASIAPEPLGGFAFLGSIGLAFALVYREDANQWWAVIPAGTLFSLAVTALVDGTTRNAGAGGAVFLFGLAATFFVLTRLPRHAQGWAIFPAAALAVLAVVALTTSGGWIVPVLLIAAGAWMLLRPDGARGVASALRSVTTTPVRATGEAPVVAEPAHAAAPAAAEPVAAPDDMSAAPSSDGEASGDATADEARDDAEEKPAN